MRDADREVGGRSCARNRFLAVHLPVVLSLTIAAYAESALLRHRPANANSAATQNSSDVRVLESGKPVERELASDETHAYQLTLASGQYLHLTFSRRAGEIAVTVFGPSGDKVAESDSMRRLDQVPIMLVTDASGSY